MFQGDRECSHHYDGRLEPIDRLGPTVTSSPTVSVIIPTLNEARNLPFVLNTIPDWVDEVLVVDGRSIDDSTRVAQVLRPGVRIIQETRPGKGAALRRGFDEAKCDILIALDADGSMDGSMIPAFYDALVAGADFVKGSRFLPGGGSADITKFRRLGDGGIALLLRLFFAARYSDVTYGYMALWANRLKFLIIDHDGFEVETLIGIRVRRARLRVTEVACYESHRLHGTSNLHALRDGFRILKVILRERFRPYEINAD